MPKFPEFNLSMGFVHAYDIMAAFFVIDEIHLVRVRNVLVRKQNETVSIGSQIVVVTVEIISFSINQLTIVIIDCD